MVPLATLVSYCGNEGDFIRPLLDAALRFSDVVVMSVGTLLYSGEPEDEAGLATLASAYPGVVVVRYDVPPEGARGELEQGGNVPAFVLHNRARKVGLAAAEAALSSSQFWCLLLDADEVPEAGGEPVAAWWHMATEVAALQRGTVYKLANHWAFLQPDLVSEGNEDSVMLAHTDCLRRPGVMDRLTERDGVYGEDDAGGPAFHLWRDVPGLDGTPMFTHFSWVRRDRAALHAKVARWGHAGQRDWHALIDNAMDALERGETPEREFVHGRRLGRLRPVAQPSPMEQGV